MRNLIIENCFAPSSYIVVDGNVMKLIWTGETVAIPIDENYHIVQCVVNNIEPQKYDWSNKVEVFSDNADYKFYLDSTKIAGWDTIELFDDFQKKERYMASLFAISKPCTRNLTIVNNCQIKEIINIVVDGVTLESVKARKKITIQINEKSHTISCFYKSMNSNNALYTNEMRIPIGQMDYKYYVKNKNQSNFNLFFKGEIGEEIELVEDNEQHWKDVTNKKKEAELMVEIRKIEYQEQREREQELNDRVTNLLEQEWRKKGQEWDFQRALSVLSKNERESRVVKKVLDFFVTEMLMKSIAKTYCFYESVYRMLGTIRKMPEYQQKVDDILKYEDILCNKQQRISSVFSDMENYADEYKKLENKYLNKFQGYSIDDSDIPRKYLMRIDEIKETYKNEQYQRNLELQMFVDADIEEFFELKEILIFIAMNPTPNEDDNLAMKAVDLCYDYFVAPIMQNEKEVTYLPTVDRIIAKTIILNRANLIDNVMDDLQKTLEVIGSKDIIYKDTYIVTTSQFEVLRKVFEHYKAPREEIAVLEAMYKYNIPRTIEQEQRLAFLKKGTTNAPKVYKNNTESKVFQYDYRVLQWSESDITNYIENFTMNSKRCTIPMAVANFEKSVMVKSFEWENKAIIPILKHCMQENFGNKYCVQGIETATVTDSIEDSIPAVFISENNVSTKSYPWLGFLVIGDQVTLKQMNLSIYALYLPDKVMTTENIVQANEKVISDVTIIKMKQNPRINNYINTVTNILIEVIEEWINNQMSYNIYE